ncbi:MAG: hypothetical protein WCQ49_02580 [Candidatus Saccharibacteria bacterium]
MTKTKVILTIIIGCLFILVTLGLLYFVPQYRKDEEVKDFASCLKANNIILEIYPRICKDKNGNSYTEVVDNQILSSQEFKSIKGTIVYIDNLQATRFISNPQIINGRIPGDWSFEASFPASLVNWNGVAIDQKTAQIQGDWMTNEYVPFTVTFEFDSPETDKKGSIILKRDNPSGLIENDDSVEIPITYL